MQAISGAENIHKKIQKKTDFLVLTVKNHFAIILNAPGKRGVGKHLENLITDHSRRFQASVNDRFGQATAQVFVQSELM